MAKHPNLDAHARVIKAKLVDLAKNSGLQPGQALNWSATALTAVKVPYTHVKKTPVIIHEVRTNFMDSETLQNDPALKARLDEILKQWNELHERSKGVT